MLSRLLRGLFRRARSPAVGAVAAPVQERLELARALQREKRISEAIDVYRELLEGGVDTAGLHAALGNCLSLLGRGAQAIPHYRRAAALDPQRPYVASSALATLNFDPDMSPEAIFQAHRDWGERLMHSVPARPHAPRPHTAGERVRVGYVSPDFKRHPVTFLFASTLEQHDRGRFEIFCYDNLGAADYVTERLRRASDAWRDVAGASDEAFCDLVESDRIDILVDLAGHTTYSRLSAFAAKPAPVQVSWLGYFNTTGLPAVDYFISDPHSSPQGQERWFVEKLVRLPDTRFCYEPPPFAPDVAPLPALGAGHVTFACFNNLSKVNERVMALWSRVLDAVSGSRLRIATVGLHDARNRDYHRERFARHGIAGDRLELVPFLPQHELLAAYGEADIALDPFPFAGGLTSFEALWMGVPVVTLPGPMISGRQTLCCLRNLGLDALVATDEESYVAAAVGLASDLDALSALRGSLRERMRASPLMDAAMFTRELERAYEGMLTRA